MAAAPAQTKNERRAIALEAPLSFSGPAIVSPFLFSPEGKSKHLHAGIEEFDLKSTVLHFSFLPDQLIQPVFLDHPRALCVGIDAVIFPGRAAVDTNPKAHRLPVF